MVRDQENSSATPVLDQQQHTRFDRREYPTFKIQELEKYNPKRSKNMIKSNQTASAADIFKKSRSMRRERKRRHDQASVEKPIINLLEDQMSEVGNEIAKDGLCTFDEALALNLRVLDSVKKEDQKAIEMISNAVRILTTPLFSEPEKVDFADQNPRNLNTSNFILSFLQTIRTEQENLQKYWEKWYEVQNEYSELYIDVFGQESSGQSFTVRENGFKNKMEKLDLENTSKIAEFEEEINKLSVHVLQKMRKSEKELDAAMKKEKTRLLTSLVSNI